MISVVLLAATLTCQPVNAARAMGLSDDQIEQIARAHQVPESTIIWCRQHCKRPPVDTPATQR